MTIEQLKKELQNVIERYANKTEFFGEVRRDDMARDCLYAVKELEAENARMKEQVDSAKNLIDAANEHLESYKNKLAARTTPKAVSDTIVELREENARLKAQVPKWISVKDSLPKEYGTYLVVRKDCEGEYVIDVFEYLLDRNINRAYWVDDFEEDTSVTHWMQLPPPPAEESATEKENG